MGRSVDYTKTLSEDTQQQIKDCYTIGKSWAFIMEKTELTQSIIVKFLMQCELYVFRDTKSHSEVQFQKQTKHYKIREVKYETDVMYKLHDLSVDEYCLFKHEEHKQLRKFNN